MDAQIFVVMNNSDIAMRLYLPWLFVEVALHDNLRAGDGARFTVASKNELLEGTQKVATEAI